MNRIKYNVLINWIIILFILTPQLNYTQHSRNIKPGASNDVILHRDNQAQNQRYTKNDYRKVDSKKKYSDKYKRDYTESENYFRVDKSKNSLWDGKHWKESDMPIKVYVKPTSSKFFKKKYVDFISTPLIIGQKQTTELNLLKLPHHQMRISVLGL